MAEHIADPLLQVEELKGRDFRIDYYSQDHERGWPVQPHFHNQFEIVLYKTINADCRVEGTDLRLEGGKALFVPPYAMHSFEVEQGQSAFTVVQCSSEMVEYLVGDLEQYQDSQVWNFDEKTFSLIMKMIEAYTEARESGITSVADKLAQAVIVSFFEEIDDENERQILPRSRFRPLLAHLHDNAIFSINGEDAAKICNLSRPHFMNAFKKQFNITYNDFLVNRKIAHAQFLLDTTDRKSFDICSELGFDDASYFVKVFKKVTGVTPKKYRSQKAAE